MPRFIFEPTGEVLLTDSLPLVSLAYDMGSSDTPKEDRHLHWVLERFGIH
jgi:hypothetical protein